MWLISKNSFVSVVKHRTLANTLLVRARREKDLIKLFPALSDQIQVDERADYKYRLNVAQEDVAARVADLILNEINYDNFKAAQDPDERAWTQFLHAVWADGFKMQK